MSYRGIDKQHQTQKVERQLLSAIRRFTLNKVFVASLSTCRPSFSHRYIVSFRGKIQYQYLELSIYRN